MHYKIKYAPFYFLSLLPLTVLYWFADFAFFVLYYIAGYRKNVIETNIKIAFPEKSDNEIKQIGKRFLRHFCTLMIESLKNLTISEAAIHKHVKVKNPELVQHYFDEGRSITLYSAHQGNWEWLAFLPKLVPHQVTSFYQPLHSSYFDGLMQCIRSRFGVMCIPSDKGYRTITKLDQENIKTMNIIIGDQRPRNKSSKHWINFFGKKTAFLVGADRIASKGKHVVIFPAFTRTKRGYYELEFKLITDKEIPKDNYDVITDYVNCLENAIKAEPFMWLWSHKRWKDQNSKV
jgi:KDO2-lipid IV(A) lauroyltransferase